MITPILDQMFVEQFRSLGIECKHNSKGIISFTSICKDVGEMVIYFDDGEITVDIENITHCHFTPYDAGPTYPASTPLDCARNAAEFVLSVLQDRRVLWRYGNGAGGTYLIGGNREEIYDRPLKGESVERFLWSGPYYGQA